MNARIGIFLLGTAISGSVVLAQPCGPVFADKLLESPTNPLQHLGDSIAVSGDLMIAGAPNGLFHANPQPGSATVYRFDGTAWIHDGFLQGPDILASDLFGDAVAIDGDRALVGSPLDNHSSANDPGSVYAYRFDGTDWVRESRLWASDAQSGDEFGHAVAMSGNLAVIGAPYDDDQGNLSGSAYIYQHNGTSWEFVTKIIPPQVDAFDRFGSAVAIDGDRVLVTAPVSTTQSLFTYEDSGSGWALVDAINIRGLDSSLTNPGESGIAVSGDHLVLGAEQSSSDPVFNHGAAIVLERDGSSWSYQQTLHPPAPLSEDTFFGISVAAGPASLLIGSGNGTAYLYRDNGAGWALDYDWAAAGTFLGWAVAIQDDTAFLGAIGDSTSETAGGAVSVYDLNCPSQECAADFTGDGLLDIFDVFAFLDLFNAGDLGADFTGDGSLDVFDVFAFLDLFNAGCP
ncbi:MAG: hypothetical protein KC996_01170 [Phycisphaerales bacterium]|nr:hypothetical protein [Phycisphaerales bacterium]